MDQLLFTNIPPAELKSIVTESLEGIFRRYMKALEQPSDQIMNVKQAADFVSLSVATMHRLTSQKKIPFSKKGRQLYFKKSELEAWLDSGRVKTVNEINAEADSWLASMAHK